MSRDIKFILLHKYVVVPVHFPAKYFEWILILCRHFWSQIEVPLGLLDSNNVSYFIRKIDSRLLKWKSYPVVINLCSTSIRYWRNIVVTFRAFEPLFRTQTHYQRKNFCFFSLLNAWWGVQTESCYYAAMLLGVFQLLSCQNS